MMHRVLSVAVWLGVVVVCHGQALPDCPPVDHRDANATLFANPSNCSTFFICRQGMPLLFECPANLHFNDRLKVCDHQLDAGCVEPPVPTPEVTKVTVTKVQKEVVVVKPAPEVVPVAEGPVDPLSKPVVSEEPVDPVVALV
ncbi:uncharacterized protein LOC144178549 [Haemaphysalis longicornis]